MKIIGNLSCERCDKRMFIEWDGQPNTGCVLEKNVQAINNLTYQQSFVSWWVRSFYISVLSKLQKDTVDRTSCVTCVCCNWQTEYTNNWNVCENRLSASSGVFVRLSVRKNTLDYKRTKFREWNIYVWRLFESLSKIQAWLNYEKKSSTLLENVH
jgi:hypothetical protein